MNESRKRTIYIMATIVSGPLLVVATYYLHLGSAEVDMWSKLIGALISSAGVAWGITSTSSAQVVADASKVADVKIKVGPDAPPKVLDLAADPAAPNVEAKTAVEVAQDRGHPGT